MPISDHFGSVANAYASCRPHYPPQLFEYLASLTERHELAWDVGAGTGQASVPLAALFTRVLATDQSSGQLAAASLRPNIEYRSAPAQVSGLPDRSVDLVTVAQAAHWFDLPAFHAEVERVLAPGGALALWTYGASSLDGAEVDAMYQEWATQVGAYWPPERKLVDEGYRTIPFPFQERTPPAMVLSVDWTLEELIGYTTTWSAVGGYRKATSVDPVPELRTRLAPSWGPAERPRRVTWPLSMRVSA